MMVGTFGLAAVGLMDYFVIQANRPRTLCATSFVFDLAVVFYAFYMAD
jgi:hypothetical protein